MGLDKFEVKISSFERYYNLFLQNSLQGKKFKIKLVGEKNWHIGIPSAGSFVNPRDLDGTNFTFVSEGNTYQIPFRNLAEAELQSCSLDVLLTVDLNIIVNTL